MEITGEFGLIEKIKSAFEGFPCPEHTEGIGDDCAILPQKDGLETLVSTDMLVDGIHFLLDDIDPYRLGWKSAAVNISDIAAMGGQPTASFLSLALPKGTSSEWMEKFIEGYRAVSLKYGVPLCGGDTTSSPDRLCISITVTGTCKTGCAKRRSTARIDDLICVTGNLGDSAAGLQVVLRGIERCGAAGILVGRHYQPEPRVEYGLALSAAEGVHAMMDISDGIASDLLHILKASSSVEGGILGAEILLDSLPLSSELLELCAAESMDAYSLAVEGGEDYELLFTVSEADESALRAVPHHIIGRIVESPDNSIRWLDSRSPSTSRNFMGFRHF